MKIEVSVSDRCTLCTLCVQVCPTEVFKISNDRLTINEDDCIYCRGCEVVCPEKAITLKLMALNEITSVHKPIF